MIAGSLAVLAALFVLLRAVTSESSTSEEQPGQPTTATTPESTPSSTPSPPSSAPSSGRSTDPTPPKHSEQRPSLPLPSGSTPADTGDDGAPGTRFNKKNLHYGLDQLITKIAANTPQVTACMGSKRPTAKVSLQFIVAHKAGKYLVEQVDVDSDQTTLEDQALLDCMMTATKTIELEGLPRDAKAIIVTRVTTIAEGAVTEDMPLKFSYLR